MTAVLFTFAARIDAQPRPAVVELFTSEGCSSCPPAEAYIGELSSRPDVLALAYHVDYWDDLGWRDRFALPQAVERQTVYARALGLSSVYTPQLVLDGRNDYVGSDRTKVANGLKQNREGIPLGISVRSGEATIEIGAGTSVTPSDVLLISYLREAVSVIARGENAGRTLKEFNIVRNLRNLGRWTGPAQSFHFLLASLPSDATDIAILVQPPGQAPIIGAASRSLR